MARSARIRTRAAFGATVGLIALVSGIAAQPAYAATVKAVQGNAYGYRAYNISLFGGVQSDTGPTPQVTLASNATNSPQNGSATCGRVAYGPAILFTSDSINVHSHGSLGPSGMANAYTTVSNINKATNTACNGASETGSEIFTATTLYGTVTKTITSLTTSTTVNAGTVALHSNASSNCTSLALPCGGHTHNALNPDGITSVPASPSLNYKVAGHVHLSDTSTDYYVIVFNEKITNPNGSVTINAAHEHFGATLDASNNIVNEPNSVLQGDLIIGRATAGVTVS